MDCVGPIHGLLYDTTMNYSFAVATHHNPDRWANYYYFYYLFSYSSCSRRGEKIDKRLKLGRVVVDPKGVGVAAGPT